METIVFDIDGVLADNKHRRHLLKRENRDWNKFFEAAGNDDPIVKMFQLLVKFQMDSKNIIFLTSRPESIRLITANWLVEQLTKFNSPRIHDFVLLMRPLGNYEKDYLLKPKVLNDFIFNDIELVKSDILYILEDNMEVISAFRDIGYLAFEAQPRTY